MLYTKRLRYQAPLNHTPPYKCNCSSTRGTVLGYTRRILGKAQMEGPNTGVQQPNSGTTSVGSLGQVISISKTHRYRTSKEKPQRAIPKYLGLSMAPRVHFLPYQWRAATGAAIGSMTSRESREGLGSLEEDGFISSEVAWPSSVLNYMGFSYCCLWGWGVAKGIHG